MSLRGGNSLESSIGTILANSLSNPSISIGISVEGKTLGEELGKKIKFQASSLATIMR